MGFRDVQSGREVHFEQKNFFHDAPHFVEANYSFETAFVTHLNVKYHCHKAFKKLEGAPSAVTSAKARKIAMAKDMFFVHLCAGVLSSLFGASFVRDSLAAAWSSRRSDWSCQVRSLFSAMASSAGAAVQSSDVHFSRRFSPRLATSSRWPTRSRRQRQRFASAQRLLSPASVNVRRPVSLLPLLLLHSHPPQPTAAAC